MKAYYKLLACLLILGFTTLNITNVSAQGQCFAGGCTGGTSYGGALSTTSATFVSAMACTYGGEYNTFNVTSGATYEWSMCPADGAVAAFGDDQLTLRTTAGVQLCYSDDYCGANAKISWTATFTGQVQVLITQYYCAFTASCNTMVWRQSSAAPSGCTNTSSYGSGAINTSGALTTISTCSYGGEYSTVTGAVSGQTLQFTMGAAGGGTYITVHSGTYDGPILAQGPSPLTFANTYTGTVFPHWNTNASCGTYFGCLTTTVQCMNCPIVSGCTNTSAYGSAAINTGGSLVTISTCSYGGEYSTITGAAAGQTLQFTMGAAGGGTFITIHTGSFNGPIVASGPSPLTYANAYTGTIYAHWNTNASCGTYFGCLTTTVQCMSCSAPSGCTNTSSYGSATLPGDNSLVTISTCSYGGEYSTIFGAVAGTTLQFTMGAAGGGTYITIHTGSYNGPVVATGPSPLTYANAYTGTLYAHWNTNASCGTYFGCLTTTVQCTSCAPPAYNPCASITAAAACGTSNTTVIASGLGIYSVGPFGCPGKERIYSYTPPVTGNYTISVSSNTFFYYTDFFYKAAAGGCNGTGWTFVTDVYNVGTTAAMALTGGTPYYFMLDEEFYTSGGTVVWTINCATTPPVNDDCSSATPFNLGTGGSTTFTGTTVGATSTGDGVFTAFPTVWHAFTITSCATVTLDYCATSPAFGDVWINLATSCPANTFVNASNWVQSCAPNWVVTFANLPAGTYWVPVLGSEAGYVTPGPYSITCTAVACPPPPANDLCSGAIAIPCGGTVTGNTSTGGFTPDANSCGGTGSNGAWYSITPSVNSFVTLSMCGSSYDTRLSVYTGSCGSEVLIPGACNDDFCGLQSQINDVLMSAGTTYLILVNGFTTGSNGAFTLTATCVPSDCSGQPNPGNTISSVANPVCGSFTLSLQNTTVGSNVTYQWESSPDGSTWTPIAGATNATLTTGQAGDTYYHCVVTCPSNPVGISNPLQVISNPNFMACYCIPVTSCTFPDIITNVTFAGINRNSTCDAPSGGYSVYTTPNPVVLMGVSTPISVSTGGDVEGIAVWIDYNHSGSFEPGEAVLSGYSGTNPATYTGSVTIPTSAAAGQTMMRVRCAYAGNALTPGPCANYTFGETEDYWIQIVPPNATSNSPVCEGDSLKLFAPTSGVSFSWTTTAGNAFTSTDQNPFIPLSSPADNGTYTVVVNTGSGSYSASVTVTVNPAPDIAASVDAPFCEGTQDLHLFATSVAATSYSWNGPGGYSSSSEDPIRTSTTASMSGAYEVIATDANGCKDSVTSTVTIYALPAVDVIVIGSNHICTGQTTSDLQASGALTYVWSTTETSDLITVSAAGTYTVTGTDIHNCINTDQEIFTESAPPAPPVIVALSDLTLCSSDGGATFSSVTLHTTNYSSDLLWSTSENTIDITVDYIDVFNVTYTDGFGCYGVSNTLATIPYYASTTPVNSQLSSDAPGNITCAVPVTLTIADALPGNYLDDGYLGDNATWVWYDEAGCGVNQVGTGTSIVITPSAIPGPHNYYVRAEGYCNTTGCASITIIVKEPSTDPSSAAASVAVLCAGDQTTLSVSGGYLGTGASWRWYAGSCGGTLVGIGASINVNTNATTTYFVRAEGDCNTTNCVSTTVTVRTLSTDPTSASSNAPVNGICIGGSVTLSVAGGSLGTDADWVWYEDGCGNGSPIGTGASITITPSYEGLHAYYVRAEGPCNETNCAAVSVLVGTYSLDPTSITTSAPGNSICGGNTVTMTVNGGFLGTVAVWKWYSGSCGGTLVGTGPSITVTPAATTTYYVRAEGSCNNSNCASVTVYRSTTPPGNPPPTIISAPNGICSGNGSTLVCQTVPGATYYSWSGPNGTTFGPNNSPSPYITTVPTTTVTFGNLPNGLSGYDICVFAANGCGTSVTKCRYIRGRVQSAQTINGNASSCPNTSSVYSITSLPGADSYTWTITGAANINGGGTTLTTTSTSITVNFLAGWTSGTLSVYGSMNCGYNAPTKTITIISTPVVPGIMSGATLVCPLGTYTYSISAVAGATGYTWSTNVVGATMTGTGTSRNITFPASIPSGSTVSVTANGSCGTSAPRVKNIATGLANAPGFITGPTIGQCGQLGVSYSILPVGGATSYLWSASNGATVSGPNNLTAVSINFPSSFVTSNISVVAINGCGNSAPGSKTVTGAPGQAGLITGNQAVCAGSFEGYSTSGAANATSYTWSIPAGAVILGPSNGNSILVNWGSTGGNVTVYGSNDCGNGASRSTAVSIICRQAQIEDITSMNATLYPNPTSGKTTVKFESVNSAKYVISVVDVTGRVIIRDEVSAAEGINMHELDLTSVAKGIYLVRMETAGEQVQLLKVTVE